MRVLPSSPAHRPTTVGLIAAALCGVLGVIVVTTCSETAGPKPSVAVASVSPSSGPLAGGTAVAITGTSFVNVTAASVGGGTLQNWNVVSSTQITGRTPVSASIGSKDVVVSSSSNGNGTCTRCFTYNPVPTIDSVNPNSGPLTGGTAVIITGTNFPTTVDSVRVGTGRLDSLVRVSATQLTGTTPPDSVADTVDVTVYATTAGNAACTKCFIYNPLPTVTGVFPADGTVAGGTEVTITGANFPTTIDSVTLGGQRLDSLKRINPNQLTGTTPPVGASGPADLTVHTKRAGNATCKACFRYNPVSTLTDTLLAVLIWPSPDTVCAGDTLLLTSAPVDKYGRTVALGPGSFSGWTTSGFGSSVLIDAFHVEYTPPEVGIVPEFYGGTDIVADSIHQGSTQFSAVGVASITYKVCQKVASVTVTPSPDTVIVGNTVQLLAILRDSSGSVVSGPTVTWQSNNSAVATVSSSGLVTAMDTGRATITATSEGISTNGLVTVVNGVCIAGDLPSAAHSLVTVSSPTVAVHGSATLLLQARDAAGVNLTHGGATVWFQTRGGTSAGTVGPTTDHCNGTYTEVYTGVVAGTATTVYAIINGVDAASTATLTVTP